MFERNNRDGVNEDLATLRAIANCLSPETDAHFASDGKVGEELVVRLRGQDDGLVHAFYVLALHLNYAINDAKAA